MKNYIIISLFLMLLLTSCGSNHSKNETYYVADEEALVATEVMSHHESVDIQVNQPENKKKIIKDGNISIKVSDPIIAKKQVDSLVRKFNAYYGTERLYNNDYQTNYELIIRVPNNSFDAFVAALEAGNGEITDKVIDAKDVTEQYIDLEIRLNNKRNYLSRYNELLKQARSIKEILEIEEINRNLEAEIESTEGQLRYLNDRVNYSSLTLNLYKAKEFKFVPDERAAFWEELKSSLSRGWYGFIDFLLLIIKIWPFWLILGVVLFFILKNRRKKLNKD